MALLLFLFIVAIGTATFIENSYDTITARVVIFNAKWFEFILVLLLINFTYNIKRYGLFSKKKWTMLTIHIGFIVVILGAGVTRYFGYEGVMLIPEKESSAPSTIMMDSSRMASARTDSSRRGSARRSFKGTPLSDASFQQRRMESQPLDPGMNSVLEPVPRTNKILLPPLSVSELEDANADSSRESNMNGSKALASSLTLLEIAPPSGNVSHGASSAATKSKTDTTHSRRLVFSHLRQKEVVTELFGDVASKVATRNGGYTRILRTGNRLGDNAEMCFIELVDYNETYVTDKPKKKAKSTRRSGGDKKASTNTPAVEEAVVIEETSSEEIVVEETKTEEIVSETTEALAAEVVAEEKAEATEETSEVKEEETKEENNAEDNETKSE